MSEAWSETVAQAISQELESIPPVPEGEGGERELVSRESDVLQDLEARRIELDAIGPLSRDRKPILDLGPDLTGADQERIGINLAEAIASAVADNLGVSTTRLQPGIRRQDVIAAEAVFDALLFTNVNLIRTDQPQRVPVIGGIPLGTPFSASERYRFETGVRQELMTGGNIEVSTDLERFRNLSPGIMFSPDPAYTAAVRLGLTQPLLRGFGRDVTTSRIRLARNEEHRSREQLRKDLLELVANAENAYWDLVFAWRNLAIAEWLLEVGIQVRDVLEHRREFDTTLAQYSDAVARVEQRRGDVIRARRHVRAASDFLKVLINDPTVTISSEAVLYPLDDTIESPIRYNVRDTMLSAIEHRPEIHQAALGLDAALIRQSVAENQRLPLLNLSAQMAVFSLDDAAAEAYENLSDQFIDYLLGVVFEYPLGNRAGEAGERQARLERSAAVLGYRQAVQNVVLEVKSALRDVITNYDLIQATRSFRVAQAENLRTLLVEEQTKVGLTPEFLNLKFTRQETLARAKQEEIQAIVNFDKSLAALYRAMGTGLTMKGISVEIEDGEDH